MYAQVTFKQDFPESARTIVVSFGDSTGRSDVNFSAKDIEARNISASETVRGRDMIVRRSIGSEGFADGIAGTGFRLDANGRGVMRSLTLFEELIAPELRYNKITAVGGQMWITSAGVVQAVTLNGDNTYNVSLRLEEGEIHEFDTNDILWSEFKTDTGFQTGRYHITRNIDSSSVVLTVLSGCAPQPSMTLVRVGNYANASRQNSIYIDGNGGYWRVLRGVATPEIKQENIVLQVGLLDGLTTKEFGVLSGPGIFSSNAYITGVFRTKGSEKDVQSIIDALRHEQESAGRQIEGLSGTIAGIQETTGRLGDVAFLNKVEMAALGETLIIGGYLKTELIKVKEIAAQIVTTDAIKAAIAEIGQLKISGSLATPYTAFSAIPGVDYEIVIDQTYNFIILPPANNPSASSYVKLPSCTAENDGAILRLIALAPVGTSSAPSLNGDVRIYCEAPYGFMNHPTDCNVLQFADKDASPMGVYMLGVLGKCYLEIQCIAGRGWLILKANSLNGNIVTP